MASATTLPSSATSGQASSSAAAMTAADLPQPTTMQRPCGLGGRCAASTVRGSAAATAASNSVRALSVRAHRPRPSKFLGAASGGVWRTGASRAIFRRRRGGSPCPHPISTQDPHRTGGRRVPPPRAASARADRCAKYRHDNLAGFCRNCLSRWYREEAAAKGIGLADPDAREIVYGMPYKEWQAEYQKEASPTRRPHSPSPIRVIDPTRAGRYPRRPCLDRRMGWR